jgi:hypothetical protein
MAFTIDQNKIHANGIDFSLLECGQGSLALCIHSFQTLRIRGAIYFRRSLKRVLGQ